MWLNELPVSSSSQFAQWCVFDLARAQGVTVLLDGQGADESLGGYEQYFAVYLEALRECGDIDRLESEADFVFRTALAKLFREESDVKQIIKLKEVYQLLESVTDKCEDVANVIESIMLKYA